MRKTIFLFIAMAVAALAVSCSPKDDDPVISIIGNFRYDGNLDSFDNHDYYDFVITDKTMDVTSMSKEHTGTFNYTRDKNKIKINPALGGKVSEATIVETSGGGFGLKLDEKNSMYFTRR